MFVVAPEDRVSVEDEICYKLLWLLPTYSKRGDNCSFLSVYVFFLIPKTIKTYRHNTINYDLLPELDLCVFMVLGIRKNTLSRPIILYCDALGQMKFAPTF